MLLPHRLPLQAKHLCSSVSFSNNIRDYINKKSYSIPWKRDEFNQNLKTIQHFWFNLIQIYHITGSLLRFLPLAAQGRSPCTVITTFHGGGYSTQCLSAPPTLLILAQPLWWNLMESRNCLTSYRIPFSPLTLSYIHLIVLQPVTHLNICHNSYSFDTQL